MPQPGTTASRRRRRDSLGAVDRKAGHALQARERASQDAVAAQYREQQANACERVTSENLSERTIVANVTTDPASYRGEITAWQPFAAVKMSGLRARRPSTCSSREENR